MIVWMGLKISLGLHTCSRFTEHCENTYAELACKGDQESGKQGKGKTGPECCGGELWGVEFQGFVWRFWFMIGG